MDSLILQSLRKDAQMAELVDALDSKSGYRKVVQVRFLFWAPNKKAAVISGFLVQVPFFNVACNPIVGFGWCAVNLLLHSPTSARISPLSVSHSWNRSCSVIDVMAIRMI